ncbi:MAG TPA: 7-cyano-7-deazaguanine synthase, partial [Candidatus Saccharimonadales bacterium]|nr:7-cyano-7-deazaguanine synthase [Candidatus Saccharimonadales bacterium]
MDSVIAAYMLIEKLDCKIAPLYVQRGARAEDAELASARRFVNDIDTRYPGKIRELLTVPAEYPPKSIKHLLPSAHMATKGHPGRNLFLVLVAAFYLTKLKAENASTKTIFIGNSPDDTFPHSSLAAVRSANIAVCIDQDDWDIQVTSPLFESELWGNVDKRQLVEYAEAHDIDIRRTHTCTASVDPCGECGECLVRLKYLN